MKIQLHSGVITTVTRDKGRELIANGEGVEYTGQDPEEIAVREAVTAPKKETEKIEVTHRYILPEEEE